MQNIFINISYGNLSFVFASSGAQLTKMAYETCLLSSVSNSNSTKPNLASFLGRAATKSSYLAVNSP